MHRLPTPFDASDLALLGYTQAKLPSDNFSFVPCFPDSTDRCDYILEVAGVRYVFKGSLDDVHHGDEVTFVCEPTNQFDSDAIAIYHKGQPLGYVNRALLPAVHNWMQVGEVNATVERKNGSVSRPLIYIRVRAGVPSEEALHGYLDGL